MRIKKLALFTLLTLGAFLTLTPGLWASGSIAGRVTVQHDADLLPVVGASVTAITSEYHFAGMARTDSNGNYQIDNLSAGGYRVMACKIVLGCLFYPGTRHPDSAGTVDVTDGMTTSGIDFVFRPFEPPPPPPPSGLLTGRITDAATGEGIAGAHVVAKPDGPLPVIFEANTGPDGRYELHVPRGDYNVLAASFGYLPGEYAGNPVHVDSGVTVSGIDIALTPVAVNFGSISGQVTNGATGAPIGHALVIAHQLGGFGFGADLTNENGNYEIGHLPAGSYRVAALARGFFPAVNPDSVPVSGGQNTPNINLALMPVPPPDLGTISGMVIDDSTGAPIVCALVAAVGFDSSEHHPIIRFAHTDSSGNYELAGLPKIAYFVLAWAHGYFGEIYDNVHRFEDATKVTPDASGINFALTKKPPSGNSVAGIVRSGIGAPLSGVLVKVLDAGGSVAGTGVTLPDGAFMIEGLSPVTYTLSAVRDDGASASQPIDLSGGSLPNLSLTLGGNGSLRGDVNRDGMYNASDVVMLLNAVFLGELAGVDPLAADLNCDGIFTAADVVDELNLVFMGNSSGVCGF